MTVLDELLEANRRFSAAFDQAHDGAKPMPPARHVAVLTCMDARLHPEAFLGLAIGDAHMIRNAGGRASDDAIRSLVISSQLLATTEFVVIHHTDCGMLTFSNEDLRGKLRTGLGADASGIDFLPFADLEQSVRDDVQRILASPFIAPGVPVSGFVYDVRSGALRQVVAPTTRQVLRTDRIPTIQSRAADGGRATLSVRVSAGAPALMVAGFQQGLPELEAARAKALADPVGAERAQRLAALLGHLNDLPEINRVVARSA